MGTIAKLTLECLTSIRKQPVFKALALLEKSQYWAQPELLAYQNQKLLRLLGHCQQNVPFYRTRFPEQVFSENQLALDHLKAYPVIDKAIMRQHLNEFIAADGQGPTEHAKTSGSTGVALHFPKSLQASAFQLGAMYRGHRWHGIEPGALEARLWGIPVNPLSRCKVHLIDRLLNRFREIEYNLTPSVLDDFYVKLLKRKPAYLMGYTSMVSQFAHYLEETEKNGRALNLKMVKCTSETIHDTDRARIERAFGCPLVSEYGAAEAGVIAFQCEAGSLHLMADCCIVEFLDPPDNADESGLKEIVVTNLDNFATPIVRYKIGDLAEPIDTPCTCGRMLPCVRNIVGRVSDIVKSVDGRRWHSIIFYYIMKGLEEKHGGVKQFKVIQTSLTNIDFIIVPGPDYTSLAEQYIIAMCKKHFGATMRVSIQIVSIIEREKSGKLRDFISKI